MADGLLAIGIDVAVLGVVKTMASINEPPAILGAMIGGALVGTFLGVFMAYCIVGPIASKNIAAHNEEQQFYFIIRDVLVRQIFRKARRRRCRWKWGAARSPATSSRLLPKWKK